MDVIDKIIKETTEIWNDEVGGGSLEYRIAGACYDAGKEAAKQEIIKYICQNHYHEDDLLEFIKKL